MIRFTVNGEPVQATIDPDTPLLWLLRDNLQLTGTKYGCGMALCGACTVHLDGKPVRSCSTPISACAGKKITTIEAIDASPVGKKVQQAWLDAERIVCPLVELSEFPARADLAVECAPGAIIETLHAMAAG